MVPLFSYSANEADSQTDTTPSETGKVVQAIAGNITADLPKFPDFQIWRRVYQKKGESRFELFLVKGDGSISQSNEVPVSYERWWNEKMALRIKKAKGGSSTSNDQKTFASFDGKWEILINDGSRKMSFEYKKSISAESETINIPGFDGGEVESSWWCLVGWNPGKDLFYFYVSGGADTGRNNDYFQFDPETKVFTHLGAGVDLNFSKEGKWVIWEDGNGMAYVDRQIHVYNIETNKDYTLTSGHSDNCFYEWVDNPTSDKTDDASSYIQNGKNLYLRHQYAQAIAEYQKAIDLDPKNDAAYGLMGYSYLREGEAQKSILSLNQSLGINPNNIMSHYNSALAFWALGQQEEAINEIKKVVTLDPSFKAKIKADPQFKAFKQMKEFNEMMDADNTSSKTLEFDYQKLLPNPVDMVQVQEVKLPRLSQTVLVSYYTSVDNHEIANATLMAKGDNAPYIVWQAEPVESHIYSSGIYYLGNNPKVPICMLCNYGGASTGARPRIYEWDGKTFQTLTINGKSTMNIGDGSREIGVEDIMGDGEKEIVVKYRPNFGDLDIIRFYKGELVFASKKYTDKYKAGLKAASNP